MLPPTRASFRLGSGLPSLTEFQDAAQRRLVNQRTLVTAAGQTYHLFNYTPQAVYQRAWNEVTTAARGLIVWAATGEVVAAPLGKFWNLGEPLGNSLLASPRAEPFEALVKLDGSLGILFRADGQVRWATRGSFDSPQSQVAQRIWERAYHQHEPLLLGEWGHLTLLVEIIHPETRVVVRYAFEDLVLIAARNRFSGEDLGHEALETIGQRLGMPVVERLAGDLEQILARVETLDDTQEGFVLRWPDGYRLKVKGGEYKRLHRILSNLTPARLAQEWREGRLTEVMLLMPEEFREEAERVSADLERLTYDSVAEVERLYRLTPEGDQRGFANWVTAHVARPLHGLFFQRRGWDAPGAGAKLARRVVAELVRGGRLAAFVGAEQGGIGDRLGWYERRLEALLWEQTRARAALVGLRAWSARLPKELRGAANLAIEDLLPETVAARLRLFAARADVREQLGDLDLELVLANVPAPSQSAELHRDYVLSQPLILRSFLDRWRQSGQRESATLGARRLLAQAIATDTLPALSAALDSAPDALLDGLARVEAHLIELWSTMPRAAQPGDLVAWAATLGARQAWGTALIEEYWAAHRDRALEAFLQAHQDDRGHTARFDDL